MQVSEVTLLLVGNTGNGKSATGNSILRKPMFQIASGTSSVDSSLNLASTTFNNMKINVVDGPGIDTNKSPEKILDDSIHWMDQALALCNYKFSALVIVLKFGSRFTKQESDIIRNLKGVLGKNVIEDYGVCVMTHGDNFQTEYQDEEIHFSQWCRQQSGEIKTLFQECNYRCVLFNNRTKDENIKASQISEIVDHAIRKKQYSESEYLVAKENLKIFSLETKAPKILDDSYKFAEGIRKSISSNIPISNLDNRIQQLRMALKECDIFDQKLSEEYGRSEILSQSYNCIKILRMEIESEIKFYEPCSTDETERNRYPIRENQSPNVFSESNSPLLSKKQRSADKCNYSTIKSGKENETSADTRASYRCQCCPHSCCLYSCCTYL